MNKFYKKIKNLESSEITALILFIAFLIIGLCIYKDYGISWDETFQMALGYKTYHFIKDGDPALLTAQNRWHGPIFQLFLIIAQNYSSDMAIYFSRHLITFLTFFSGSVVFYFLARRLLQQNWLALISVTALILSPRIFADSFYNSKDIPFLVFYIFSLYSMLCFIDNPTWKRALIHSLLSAILISIRIPGLFIIALTYGALLYEMYNKKIKIKQALISGLTYGIVSIIGCMVLWPSLWPDPINNFLEAFASMSHFGFNAEMRFMGKIITPSKIPWYYIPVWMGITIPILYILTFFPGFVRILSHQKTILKRNNSLHNRDELLILLAFAGPLLAVIILHSSLYDGWRQMFFIYPAFLLIAAKGMQWIWYGLNKHLKFKTALSLSIIVLLIGFLPVLNWMIREHPYQNVYFNRIAGKDMKTIQQSYMVDYWGLSYREGLEYLVAIDNADQISVYAETEPGEYNIPLLPLEDAVRVHIVRNLSEADYYIGNYYMQNEPYPLSNEIFSIKVGNASILSIFKLTPDEKD